jgi:hypothetical protein
MIIRDVYSHKDGERYIIKHHQKELDEIISAIDQINVEIIFQKKTLEKTKSGTLFSPKKLNASIYNYLEPLGWDSKNRRIKHTRKEFREIDGLKNRVGLELQFGKYAFMGYDILLKMPIFHKKGIIDCGVEVVVMPSMIKYMSTGIGSFTQITSDLRERGVSDLDIPTIIIGIDCKKTEWEYIGAKKHERSV